VTASPLSVAVHEFAPPSRWSLHPVSLPDWPSQRGKQVQSYRSESSSSGEFKFAPPPQYIQKEFSLSRLVDTALSKLTPCEGNQEAFSIIQAVYSSNKDQLTRITSIHANPQDPSEEYISARLQLNDERYITLHFYVTPKPPRSDVRKVTYITMRNFGRISLLAKFIAN
jgi:hypothetical protein